MKKTIIFMFLFMGSFLITNSQTEQEAYVSGPTVLSPGPNASGLGKYAEFPVSLYTGLPNISLPIYTVSTGDLSVPISLSYHSKGVRLEDQASWVGLGWSLNAGGVITRSVVGLPDDQVSAYSSATNTTCGGIMTTHEGFISSGAAIEGLYNTPIIGSPQAPLLYEMSEGGKDGEPDKFFFNFNGLSGEFVLDKNGVPSIMSDQKLAITYTRNASQRIISFKVVDQNGTGYYFNEAELTHYYLNNCNNCGINFLPTAYMESTFQNFGDCEYYSSWFLTKVENANKTHEINLTYTNEDLKDTRDFSYEKKNWLLNGNTQESYSSKEYFISGKRLSSITWTGGTVTFEATHVRKDIGKLHVSDNRTTTNYALTKVSVKDYNNVVQKSYLLDYAYFLSTDYTPANSDENCLVKRLKLLSLTEESNTTGVTNPPHQFFYDETTPLPYKASPFVDYWGYSNVLTTSLGAGGSGDYVKQYFYPDDAPDAVTKSRYSLYPRSSYTTQIIINGYDKSPNFTYMKIGVLTKIVFPTKGSTEFEYEPNNFYFMSANRIGGGLRIKKSTTYDGIDHAKDIIKTYDYTLSADPAKSSGLAMYLPFFAKYEGYHNSVHRHTLYTNSICGLGTTQGGYVGYQEVTTHHNGNGKVWSRFHVPAAFGVDNEDWTGTAYIYTRTYAVDQYYIDGGGIAYATQKVKDNWPYAQNPNYDWNRGALLEEKVYDNYSLLVKRTLNEYTIKDHKKILAVKNAKLSWVCSSGGATYPSGILHKIARYYVLSGWRVMSKQTVEDYDPATSAMLYKTETWYNYDNPAHMLLTSTKSYDSKNRELKTELKRPQDYTVSTNFTNDLITQHRYAPVLEELTWQNDGTGYKLLGANFTTYGNYATANALANPQWLPNKSYVLETATPIATGSFTATVINNSSITLDSRYKQVGEFNYGAKDNITRYSFLNAGNKNNSAYIWGYTKQYAIAKVNNATETDCGFTGFESDDQNLWTLTGTAASTDAHTGLASRSIPANTFGPGRDYVPNATYRNEKFIMSCWVKTTAAYANNAGSLVLYTKAIGGSVVYPAVPAAYVATAISNTNNTWKYVEVEIDLKKVKTDGGLPLTTDLQITSFLWNTDPANYILIDDIRFYPKEARMSSYTYAPLKGTTSMSDENSDAIYYEYDNFGRLKLVKDQFGRIIQKTEYNYKP